MEACYSELILWESDIWKFLYLYMPLTLDQFLLWNQTCRHLIMLVAATTLPSLMWKPWFFPQIPPGTTKKKIQRLPRNFNPRSNKQNNNASISISSNWNQICRRLIMLVAATTLSSLMWKPCFFPQMPPGTTKKKIQPLRLFFFSLYCRPMPSKVFFPEHVGPLKKLQYSPFYSA